MDSEPTKKDYQELMWMLYNSVKKNYVQILSPETINERLCSVYTKPLAVYYLSMDMYKELIEYILKHIAWHLYPSVPKPTGYMERLIECYHAPLNQMPLLINNEDNLLSIVSRWRLKIGR
jgi:hypothetical protein